jgi:hypothetical protein
MTRPGPAPWRVVSRLSFVCNIMAVTVLSVHFCRQGEGISLIFPAVCGLDLCGQYLWWGTAQLAITAFACGTLWTFFKLFNLNSGEEKWAQLKWDHRDLCLWRYALPCTVLMPLELCPYNLSRHQLLHNEQWTLCSQCLSSRASHSFSKELFIWVNLFGEASRTSISFFACSFGTSG